MAAIQAASQRIPDNALWMPPHMLLGKRGLNVAVFGYPGSGKSTLAASGPKPLIVDIDGTAALSLSDRDDVMIAPANQSYDQVTTLSDRLLGGGHPFETICFDTITTFYSMALKTVKKVSATPDTASQPEYGKANEMVGDLITKWCNKARETGINVVFNIHVKEDKDENAGTMLIRMALTPGSTLEVYRAVDSIGYLDVNNKTEQRKLLFKSNGRVVAKHHQPQTGPNRIPLEILDPNLGTIINAMKGIAPFKVIEGSKK
jgi:AAA domain